MNKGALILFTRIPMPGRVKTRLIPLLSGAECAALQRAMTLDTAHTLAAFEQDLFICYSDEGPVELLDGLPDKAELLPQLGEGLGERMYRALETVLTRGYQNCLLLGSDLPFLRPQDVEEAGRILERNDVVLCPSPDGGYWLVGMHRPFQPLFQGQNYGTGSVLADAIENCVTYGLRVGLGPILRDLDTPEDLACLMDTIPPHASAGGSRTMAWLHTWMGRVGHTETE